jgi:hypothetical protein
MCVSRVVGRLPLVLSGVSVGRTEGKVRGQGRNHRQAEKSDEEEKHGRTS